MKTHIHTEAEYNEYLAFAENGYEEFDTTHSYEFAKRAVKISRELGISIESAEFLIEEHGVYIPNKDRDIAIMVIEMGLTLPQATKLYESGFHIDNSHVRPSPFMKDDSKSVSRGASVPQDIPF